MEKTATASVAIDRDYAKLGQSIRDLIFAELDLGYANRQNVLLSCNVDGCNRISYCSCDCNDGTC